MFAHAAWWVPWDTAEYVAWAAAHNGWPAEVTMAQPLGLLEVLVDAAETAAEARARLEA